MNPSPATASLTKSSATRRSSPVRSRRVYAYSALVSRRIATGPGSPWCSSMNRRSPASTSRMASSRCGPLGCGSPSGGIFRSRSTRTTFSQSLKRRPNSGRVRHRLEVDPRLGLVAAVAFQAILPDQRSQPRTRLVRPRTEGERDGEQPEDQADPPTVPTPRDDSHATTPSRRRDVPASARRETAEESRHLTTIPHAPGRSKKNHRAGRQADAAGTGQ